MVRRNTTNGKLRRRSLGLMAGMVVFGLAAGNVSAAQASAVSDTVHLSNRTGCTLLLTAYWLDHGVSTVPPNSSIPAGTTDWWKTESSGLWTGTEGHVRYLTINCANSALNYRFVEVHWDNPYAGGNTYDYAGTSWPFIVPHSGGGGYQASVYFIAQQ